MNIHCLWQNSHFINMEYVKLKYIYIYITHYYNNNLSYDIWLCLKIMYTWLCYMFFFPLWQWSAHVWGGRATMFHQIQMEWSGYLDDTTGK